MTHASQRTDWVDYARGACIILVVMMHATLGVEAAAGREGWMHAAVEFARPFRIPAFFFLSGLFVSRVIDRDWREFLDRRVLHFAYFYVLWLTIQFAFKLPGMAADHGVGEALRLYLVSFVDPFGTLWFIYLLPIFFVAVRLLRSVSPAIVWLVAAALEIAPIATGWTVVDEFAARFVYFYSGYLLMPRVFAFAEIAGARNAAALAAIAGWAVLNGVLVWAGYADRSFVSLALGYLGTAALVAGCALLAQRHLLPALGYCGRHSLPIYLSFFLPVAAARATLLRVDIFSDIGTVALLVTAAGVAGALLIHRLLRGGKTRFLFERPDRFRLKPRLALVPQR